VESRDQVRGLYDTHIHPGPDPYARVADAYEVVEEAKRNEMGGVVLKVYEFMTPQLATLLTRRVPGIDVVGAVCLEGTQGGISPRATEVAIRAGAKVVWLPALDSEWNDAVNARYQAEARATVTHLDGLRNRSDPRGRLSPVRNGVVTPEALEVFGIVGQADIVLQSGHLNEAHRQLVAEAALAQGVRKFVLTHANASWNYVPIEQARALSRYDNVYFEICALPLLPWIDNQRPEEVGAFVRAVGPERIVLGTDAGVSWTDRGIMNPHPVEALAALVGVLKRQGFGQAEIELMGRQNPRRLFNLD